MLTASLIIRVARTKEQEWRPSVRSVPELDGLGGATNFRSIDAESAGRVKEYLDRVNLNE